VFGKQGRAPYVPPPPPPPPPPPCDTSCTDTFADAKEDIDGIKDPLAHSHALCQAINQLFSCECDSCNPEDPNRPGLALQEELCSPSKQVQLQAAGGPCTGFAQFCAQAYGAPYCAVKAFQGPPGSSEWLANHQIEDPGNSSAAAGANLAQAQLPQYMKSAISAMVDYFDHGSSAETQGARLSGEIAAQIAAFEPDADDAAAQDAAFGGRVSVPEAKKYAQDLRNFQAALKDEGAELPEATNKELDQLESAADNYNAAPARAPQAPLVAALAALAALAAYAAV
jgi:hypothetical protein